MLGVKIYVLAPKLGEPPEIGVGVGVGAVDVGVGVGEPVVEPPSTSMPLTWALSVTVVNWIVMFPPLAAVALNCSTTALYSAPVVATISKLVSTCWPLILTLKTR